MPRRLLPLLAIAALLTTAAPARADATAFLGAALNPDSRLARGWAIGFGFLVIGFEFEYATISEDLEVSAPGLTTGMFNVLGQTLPVNDIQFYATAGGGLFRERLGAARDTNFGVNVGGGVKWKLAGPLRLRLDYRVFRLNGADVREATVQRAYAGLNLAF